VSVDIINIPLTDVISPKDYPYTRAQFDKHGVIDLGCFHCLRTFTLGQVTEWIGNDAGDALCPFCSVDSVVGTTDEQLLTAMMERGFHFFSRASAYQERGGDDFWIYRPGPRDPRGPLSRKYHLRIGDKVRFLSVGKGSDGL
jgi:hypothetical protein